MNISQLKNYAVLILLGLGLQARSQSTTLLVVKGDLNKFYPVVFQDGNWTNHMPTEIEFGRSAAHQDASWRGSLMAKISFHNTRWGNLTQFTNTELWQQRNSIGALDVTFIAGYADASIYNNSADFIIWLKGSTTYYYRSNVAQSPVVYDGVQNPLPFQEINGPQHSFKTVVEASINSWGTSTAGTMYAHGRGTNYMAGNLALGVLDPKGYKLAVNGKVRAHEIKVEGPIWPDYVFAKSYSLPDLFETEKYIQENQHLPGIPSALEVKDNGIDLGEMNAKLLEKIEELTLHLIEMKKENDKQNQVIQMLQSSNTSLTEEFKKFKSKK